MTIFVVTSNERGLIDAYLTKKFAEERAKEFDHNMALSGSWDYARVEEVQLRE